MNTMDKSMVYKFLKYTQMKGSVHGGIIECIEYIESNVGKIQDVDNYHIPCSIRLSGFVRTHIISGFLSGSLITVRKRAKLIDKRNALNINYTSAAVFIKSIYISLIERRNVWRKLFMEVEE